MMTTCPRCNFTQPKDRFCANCGLDMDNYKKKPKPFLELIWNSGWTQLLIFTVLFSITGYYLTAKYKEKKFLRAIVETFTDVETEEEFENNEIEEPSPQIEPQKMVHRESNLPVAKDLEEIKFKDAPELPPPPQNIIINFAEATINYLSGLSSNNVQGQMLKATTLELDDDIGPYITKQSSLASLPGATNGRLSENSPVSVNKTFSYQNEEYGLEVIVTPLEINEDASNPEAKSPYKISLKIQINFSLPPEFDTAEPQQISVEETISVNADDEIVLSEIFPRVNTSVPDEVKTLIGSTPMSAFLTNEYKNQETDLIIFLQLR